MQSLNSCDKMYELSRVFQSSQFYALPEHYFFQSIFPLSISFLRARFFFPFLLTGRAIEKRSPGKQISTKKDCLGLTLASWKRQKCGWFGTMLEILFTNSRRSGTFWDQGREQDFCLGEVNFLLHLDIAKGGGEEENFILMGGKYKPSLYSTCFSTYNSSLKGKC